MLEQKPLAQRPPEVDVLFKLTSTEADRSRSKRELIRRLTHIERLAKQKDYAEIEKLLQENYV